MVELLAEMRCEWDNIKFARNAAFPPPLPSLQLSCYAIRGLTISLLLA